MFGKAYFSESVSSLDSVWSEICDKANGMLSYGENPDNQPIALLEAIEGMKPAQSNIYGSSIDDAAYNLTLDIFRKFILEQEYENNPRLKDMASKLIEKNQTYKKYHVPHQLLSI